MSEITPVDEDATATAADLLVRARADYARAQERRDSLDREDRTHGQQVGGVA